MRLSIITINLNNYKGLQKTIDSIVAQTFKNFEWIVIDGGSTDGSYNLIEQYSGRIDYWVSEPDKGIYNAMNKGIDAAKGEYLQFLNSGDWFCDETALERCFSHHFDADIVYGDLLFCNGDVRKKYHYPDRLSFRFLYDYSLGHSATFIKKDVMKEDLYDETLKIVSDWKFFLKQALRNRRFKHIEEFVACFDAGGISSVNGNLVKVEREKVMSELFPQLMLEDFRKMNELEMELNGSQVKNVREYGRKKVLYHKMITACLLTIKFIDKLVG